MCFECVWTLPLLWGRYCVVSPVMWLNEEEVFNSKARVIFYSSPWFVPSGEQKLHIQSFPLCLLHTQPLYTFVLMNQEARLFCINKQDFNKDIEASQMCLASAQH